MQRIRVVASPCFALCKRRSVLNVRTFCDVTDAMNNDEKLPVSFEDISRAYFRLQGGVYFDGLLFVVIVLSNQAYALRFVR